MAPTQPAGIPPTMAPPGYGQASPTGYGQASPMMAPPGYGQASPTGYGQASPTGYGQASYPGPLGSAQDTPGGFVGAPHAPFSGAVRGPAGWPTPVGIEKQLGMDSKLLETKVAQDKALQYDGGKSGSSWRPQIKKCFMSKIPILKHLLEWAEDFKKDRISMQHV